MQSNSSNTPNYRELARQIKAWAHELGFVDAHIGPATLPPGVELGLTAWLAEGFHGEMGYMAEHGMKRARPAELVPGTLSVISLRMNYWPGEAKPAEEVLADGSAAYISRYAVGRDYHKVLRAHLQKLANRVAEAIGPFGHRVFTDSAPVMEVAASQQSGLGWRGKHTLLLTREQGSLFFLGELFTDLPLPADAPMEEGHCGRCTRCLEVCPTGAIVAPYRVDARRCISYLTIELKGPIPRELRPLIGNRVYGCDDCQLVCPWNRFAVDSSEADFTVRHGLDDVSLVSLFGWDEDTFRTRMAGSPIYRIGYAKWLSNIAIGLGNAPTTPGVIAALQLRQGDPRPLVCDAVEWALAQHGVTV